MSFYVDILKNFLDLKVWEYIPPRQRYCHNCKEILLESRMPCKPQSGKNSKNDGNQNFGANFCVVYVYSWFWDSFGIIVSIFFASFCILFRALPTTSRRQAVARLPTFSITECLLTINTNIYPNTIHLSFYLTICLSMCLTKLCIHIPTDRSLYL